MGLLQYKIGQSLIAMPATVSAGAGMAASFEKIKDHFQKYDYPKCKQYDTKSETIDNDMNKTMK